MHCVVKGRVATEAMLVTEFVRMIDFAVKLIVDIFHRLLSSFLQNYCSKYEYCLTLTPGYAIPT